MLHSSAFALFFLKRWPRFRRGLLATTWLALFGSVFVGKAFQEPGRSFERITQMSWSLAPCVAEFHGSGLQDRRHLWIFQGTPEQFEKHLSGVPWRKSDELSAWGNQDDSIGFRRARQTFGSEPWVPAERYTFYNDRYGDPEDGDPSLPHGNANLWVDAKHERWIIYWDGM